MNVIAAAAKRRKPITNPGREDAQKDQVDYEEQKRRKQHPHSETEVARPFHDRIVLEWIPLIHMLVFPGVDTPPEPDSCVSRTLEECPYVTGAI